MASSYKLEIMTPERLFFDGEVESLHLEGSKGQMSVWKGHTPMLLTMSVGELLIHLPDGQEKLAVHSDGFVEVRPDRVLVFAQSCEWPEEIDAARAQAAYDKAHEKLRQQQSIVEHKGTEIALARAMTRLRLKKGR